MNFIPLPHAENQENLFHCWDVLELLTSRRQMWASGKKRHQSTS